MSSRRWREEDEEGVRQTGPDNAVEKHRWVDLRRHRGEISG